MRTWIVLVGLLAAGAAVGQALKPGPIPVRGAPYTAERVVTSSQKLADGTMIQHHTSSLEARDSAGRTWSKWELPTDPLRKGPKQFRVGFYDPDSRIKMEYCTCSKFVNMTRYAEPRPLPTERLPGPEGMDVYVGPNSSSRLKYHAEDLPGQMIQGVMTRGSKVVRVLPAGTDGNDHELTTTILSWYSPELHLAMTTIIDDPVAGLKKLEFTNLKRVEPDPAIFQLPPGSMVRDAPPQ